MASACAAGLGGPRRRRWSPRRPLPEVERRGAARSRPGSRAPSAAARRSAGRRCRPAYTPTASNTAITVSTPSTSADGTRWDADSGKPSGPRGSSAHCRGTWFCPVGWPGSFGGHHLLRPVGSLAMSELKSPLPAGHRRAVGAARRAEPGRRRRPGRGRGGRGPDRRGRARGWPSWTRRPVRSSSTSAPRRDPAGVPGAADGAVAGRRLPLPRPGAAEDPARRRAGRAGRDRPLGLVHRPGHCADAVVHEHRRVRGLRARWWTPGRRSAPCAQIGKNVHLSGGVGIGGVLEPPRPSPSWSRTSA